MATVRILWVVAQRWRPRDITFVKWDWFILMHLACLKLIHVFQKYKYNSRQETHYLNGQLR